MMINRKHAQRRVAEMQKIAPVGCLIRFHNRNRKGLPKIMQGRVEYITKGNAVAVEGVSGIVHAKDIIERVYER